MATIKRKAIKKSVRFEIFKRDGFSCQYCGAHPPGAILHVDHINPVKNGGTNNLDNLVTSCDKCNYGKSARLLSNVPQSLKERADETRERELQIQGYSKVFMERHERIENEAWRIVFELTGSSEIESYPKKHFQSIRVFLEKLPLHVVLDAAEIASAREDTTTLGGFKYFCAICWRHIREGS